MWKVVRGPYYWKHKICTRDKDERGDSKETCIVRVPSSFMLIFFMFVFQFEYGGNNSRMSSFWLGYTKPIDGRLLEFIAVEVTRSIVDATPVMFGTIKEGIMELLDDRLGAFRAEMATGQLDAHRELKACRGLEFFGRRTIFLNLSRRDRS